MAHHHRSVRLFQFKQVALATVEIVPLLRPELRLLALRDPVQVTAHALRPDRAFSLSGSNSLNIRAARSQETSDAQRVSR